MKKIILVFLLFLSYPVLAQEGEALEPRDVIVLGSFSDYQTAKNKAVEIAGKTGVLYSDRGLVWDEKRGLIFPDNFIDPAFAGDYYGRRSQFDCNKEAIDCVSVEKSDFYEGFTPGLYVLVGGVMVKKAPETKKLIKKFKKIVPDVYVKQTTIYMGCLH